MNLKGDYGNYGGRWPAEVESYDKETRTCRVKIEGITDGADNLPVAEIEYPIGDKSRSGFYETEIEILPHDTVWVAFINGDYRYPIITGYRNPSVNNSIDWRRWHHKNVEIIADYELRLVVGTSSIVMFRDHIWIDAERIDENTAHDRSYFLKPIAEWEKTVKKEREDHKSD
ncbi:MAG: hypothetical protein J0649_09160 [Methylococcales bacterium]|jgi:hypothetical protein|nr:hypothetical protein [Methylococcales bacterium]